METDYQTLQFAYRRAPDQDAPAPVLHPVVVVGAGPVGLATAIDLAQYGQPVVLLDDDSTLSTGSRAICFAKRTLDIFDRLGCGQRMVDKGVSWQVGRVFFREHPLYSFDLLPEAGHARPAFVNLQQYYVEGYLAERALQLPQLSLRWRNRVTALAPRGDHVELEVDTPEGPYRLAARYVVAADGSRSPLRKMLGLEARGRTFKDRFLIADVKMRAGFPSERWFWFDPPFHPNQSVLLHRQPDDVWRIDFQLGWDADPELEKQPERVMPRVRALLGDQVEFELQWVSVYTFSCQRMAQFRHGRVLFAGDAAHGVSPFGARGANSGVQDAENLAWKLRYVLRGQAPDALLDSYGSEREYAADENILYSTRSTDFITPKTPVSRVFRDAVLSLAESCEFARKLVNSGRLSMPTVLRESPLNTPDESTFSGAMVPGAPCADAPAEGAQAWLLPYLGGAGFTLLWFVAADGLSVAQQAALSAVAEQTAAAVPLSIVLVIPAGAAETGIARLREQAARAELTSAVLIDRTGLIASRYDAQPGTVYLIRPDQHVCARWRRFDAVHIGQALARASGCAVSSRSTPDAVLQNV
jgi:3-(3-hydroxy-phenyl)propionate hydroxylase